MSTNRLPPLNALRAFEAAARHESFLVAADKQGVTPGSISRHVKLLERYLGTELFVRRSNGVALTSAGRAYAERVRGIFRDLRAATDGVRKPPRERAIMIATLPIFSERWLHCRIPSFRRAFDGVELRVEVHSGEHDADREDVDAWDSDWPDWARAVGATAGEPAADMRFALYNGVIQAAVDGMGVALGHGEMVARELAAGKLVPLAHLAVVSEKSYHLVMNASSTNNRTLVRLREWLLQECAGGWLPDG